MCVFELYLFILCCVVLCVCDPCCMYLCVSVRYNIWCMYGYVMWYLVVSNKEEEKSIEDILLSCLPLHFFLFFFFVLYYYIIALVYCTIMMLWMNEWNLLFVCLIVFFFSISVYIVAGACIVYCMYFVNILVSLGVLYCSILYLHLISVVGRSIGWSW